MKKRILTVVIIVASVFLLLAFTGCDYRYSSSYTASTLVQTNSSKKVSVSFGSMKGTMVYKLKCGNENEKINYSAKLEEGSATVYYDSDGTKTKLFTVSSGDDITDVGGELQKGTVYIIIEATETVKDGSFSFEVK